MKVPNKFLFQWKVLFIIIEKRGFWTSKMFSKIYLKSAKNLYQNLCEIDGYLTWICHPYLLEGKEALNPKFDCRFVFPVSENHLWPYMKKRGIRKIDFGVKIDLVWLRYALLRGEVQIIPKIHLCLLWWHLN